MAFSEGKLSDIRRSDASFMTMSLTSLDIAGEGLDQTDGPVFSTSKRNSKPEWEFTYEKTSNLIKELKKSPEFNRKTIQNYLKF